MSAGAGIDGSGYRLSPSGGAQEFVAGAVDELLSLSAGLAPAHVCHHPAAEVFALSARTGSGVEVLTERLLRLAGKSHDPRERRDERERSNASQ
jgi:hypothetical protein